jgi:MFS family permease
LNAQERRILIVTCFGHFLCHYNVLVFPALVLPLAGSLNLEMAQVLGLSFWMYLLFGLSALPWGLAGDRWGGKTLMLIMFLGAGVSGLFSAYSLHSPVGLSVALAGLGLFSGIYHPIGLGLISKGVRRLSVAMGYNAVFGGLGLVLAPLITGILNWLSGPQAAFLFVGAVNLGGLAIMALLPLGDSAPSEAESSGGGNGMLGAFLILLVIMTVGGLAYRGSTLILPAYLELKSGGIFAALSGFQGMHLSNNLLATTITALIYVAGMVGQYIGGHVGERFEPRYSYLFFHAVCIPAVLLMTFATNLQLIGLATVYFFFLLGMQPIENTLVARFSPRRLHHSAYGLKFILTFGIGALAVKMVQWIDSAWGVEAIFPALAIMSAVIVATIMLLIHQTNPRPAKVDQPVAEVSTPGDAQVS